MSKYDIDEVEAVDFKRDDIMEARFHLASSYAKYYKVLRRLDRLGFQPKHDEATLLQSDSNAGRCYRNLLRYTENFDKVWEV